MQYLCTPAGTADINDSAGTDQFLIDAPFAGKINVAKSYVVWTEATGSQTSTIGTIVMKVDGDTVGTMTAPQSGTIGDTTSFVVDGTYATAADPYVYFSAGDPLLLEIGTQASGGTVTGDGVIHLCVEYDVGA